MHQENCKEWSEGAKVETSRTIVLRCLVRVYELLVLMPENVSLLSLLMCVSALLAFISVKIHH